MDRTLENIAAVATTDVNGFYSAGGVTVGSHDLVAISVDGKHRGIREDKSKVMRAYKTRGTPWTVIIDKKGRLPLLRVPHRPRGGGQADRGAQARGRRHGFRGRLIFT